MATKIETSLTPDQLQEFFRRCGQLKGCLLKDIQALAEESGVEISLMSAGRFRQGAFAEYLEELKAKREMAENVASVAKQGLSLSDAAASVLSQKIFDQAIALDNGTPAALEDANTLSLALSRLRLGDQRAQLLERRIREYERAEQEWSEQRQAIKAATDKVRQATPATADEIRAAAVEEIDRIMGLKK